MKIRVVGGPIRRSDRVVVEATSHSTFESLLQLIHEAVDELDMQELANDLLDPKTRSKSNTGGGGGNESFGERIQQDSPSGTDSDTDEEHKHKQEQRRAAPSAPLATIITSPPDSAVEAPNCLRLSKFPIDVRHYDICLFELDPTGKAHMTYICHPLDTPQSVGLKIPAVALSLKRAYRQSQGPPPIILSPVMAPNHHGCPHGAMLVSPPMAFANSSSSSGLESPPAKQPANPTNKGITPTMNFSFAPGASPSLISLVSPPQESLHVSRTGNNLERSPSWSRAQSFRLAHTGQSTRTETSGIRDRAFLVYQLSANHSLHAVYLDRLLNRMGKKQQELFVDTACKALRREASGSHDGPLGVDFSVHRVQDFLVSSIRRCDPLSDHEAASILADMVVHAAPAGEEKPFSSIFVGEFMAEEQRRRVRHLPILSALRLCGRNSSRVSDVRDTDLLLRLECMHREHLCRMEAYRLSLLFLLQLTLSWMSGCRLPDVHSDDGMRVVHLPSCDDVENETLRLNACELVWRSLLLDGSNYDGVQLSFSHCVQLPKEAAIAVKQKHKDPYQDTVAVLAILPSSVKAEDRLASIERRLDDIVTVVAKNTELLNRVLSKSS